MIVPARLNALVIDDNQYSLALATDALKKLGIKSILTARDATEGLSLAQGNNLDFVVLDWYMPDINGAGFTRLVRGGRAGCPADLPIIVATAYATRENIRRINELGIKEILVKPFKSRQLGVAISSALSKADFLAIDEIQDEGESDKFLI